MDSNEKIQLDDITLDDIISGEGVATEEIAPAQEDEKKVESPEENKLEEEKSEPSEELEDKEEEEDKEDEEDKKKDYEDDGKEEDIPEDDTVVAEVLTKLGYEVDKSYSDTSDGLVEMTKDVASKMADDRIDEVLDQFPLVKQHLDYVLAGGESQNFMQAYDPTLDYNKLNLDEEDTRSQKAVLSDYFTVKGHDKEFIDELLGDYEDTGKLHAKAEAARKALGKVQEEKKGKMLDEQKETMREQQKQQEDFWNEIAGTIEESKEFAGLQVPEKEKSSFFKWLSSPVTKEGHTQRDVDHAEAKIEIKLAIDYLMYKGFDLEGLINTKANTKAARSLREKISNNEETVKSARKKSRRSKRVDLDDLDLSI